MKRLSVSVSDATYTDLEYIARLDESSVSNVVRDCIRAMLPQLRDITTFIHDPRNAPSDVLAFADQMERALDMVRGAVGVGAADETAPTDPVRRRYAQKPPTSNTGVK